MLKQNFKMANYEKNSHAKFCYKISLLTTVKQAMLGHITSIHSAHWQLSCHGVDVRNGQIGY